MDISIKWYWSSGWSPYKIIEMVFDTWFWAIIRNDITNLKWFVDPNFISNLREIADELEEQNSLLSQVEL